VLRVRRGDVHANDVAYVRLGKLNGVIGNQNYPMLDDVNLDDLHRAVIYCKLVQVVSAIVMLWLDRRRKRDANGEQ
jgi:hypothetical protein